MNRIVATFRWPFIITGLGLLLAFVLGWFSTGKLGGAVGYLLIGGVLAILEISLSFDNAIVNAKKLQTMSPLWQRRFLTWGILIAVFGMRILFPLMVVALAAHVGPLATLALAMGDPVEYARIMQGAHLSIAGFGGAFLMMVALSYFIDEAKDVDWFRSLEIQLRRCATVRWLQLAMVVALIMVVALLLPSVDRMDFVVAAILGLMTFIGVDLLGRFLDQDGAAGDLARVGGLGAFLYLEVLDASFSFDGVIGAFALTQNIFLIAIGLGIGAVYVRAMTVMLVEKQTLVEFRYIEHGAFYSILVLALIMFAQTLWHIPEMITGLIGASLIGWALWSSIRYNRAKLHG